MEIYLDNAATSHPKPPSVLQAVQTALTALNGNPGRSGHRRALSGARKLLQSRETISSLLGADEPGSIVFCLNGTDALNMAIKGSLHIGDHVVATVMEHNSVLRVVKGLESQGLIETTLLEPDESGTVSPDMFEKALRPNTALCVSTQASNVTGAIQPAAAIGDMLRRHGIRYLIDGAQAVGHVPVNVKKLKCDLYAFPGHKGLLGPQGTGGLYVAPGLRLKPLREGGTGSNSESMIQPDEPPECYESGTVNLSGIAGLQAGAEMALLHGRDYLDKERALTQALYEGLAAMPDVTMYSPAEAEARVSVLSFNIGDMTSSAAADLLDQHGIAVRAGLHCAPGIHAHLGTLRRGAVRVSPNWQNTFEEVEQFLRIVRWIGKR